MQLLLVDPQQTLPDGVSDFLTESGWTVTSAPTYVSAAETAATITPDAVIAPQPPIEADPTDTDGFRQLVQVIENRQVATLLVSQHKSGVWLEESPFIDKAATR